MVLCILIVAGFLYYPMWRFNKQWQLLQVGDSIDRMEALFGYLPEPSYSVQSNTAATDVYLYRKYWKSYEVTVSPASHTVLSKITSP
jgi:hypothetical protein